jgi:hypothetical protein
MNRTLANRRARTAFAVAGAAVVVALAVAASDASKAVGSALACPSLRNVIGFTGTATALVGAVVQGESPPVGTETIQLGRVISKVHVYLGGQKHGGVLYDFKGGLTGGSVLVDDFLEDTGMDYAGRLQYDGPAKLNFTQAFLGFDRGIPCAYKVSIGAEVVATYTGDPEVDDGHLVGFGVFSSRQDIPQSLKLHGSESLHTYRECGDDARFLENAPGCAILGTTWDTPLITLIDCGTTDPIWNDPSNGGNCVKNDNPELGTPATFTWNLKPIFKKK